MLCLQSGSYKGVVHVAGLPALVAEEKVVFGLNAKAVTHLTLAKIRKVYSRVDNKSIAKQVIIPLQTYFQMMNTKSTDSYFIT